MPEAVPTTNDGVLIIRYPMSNSGPNFHFSLQPLNGLVDRPWNKNLHAVRLLENIFMINTYGRMYDVELYEGGSWSAMQ